MNQTVTALVVDKEQVFRALSDAMSVAINTSTRSLEEAAETLNAIYKGHMYVCGTFSVKETYRGAEFIFAGTVCGDNITHAIWC